MQMEKLESRTEKAFQSHIGAIRMNTTQGFRRFVRQFQSHIGAIRILSGTKTSTPPALFQSHIGAIRIEHLHILVSQRLNNFNPTLVQLESFNHAPITSRTSNFNPTLVQLELKFCRLETQRL